MTGRRPRRLESRTVRRYLPWALFAVAAIGLVLLPPGRLVDEPLLALLYLLLGAAGARYRPWGPLGLAGGLLVLPTILARFGAGPAAWAAAVISVSGTLGAREGTRRSRRFDEITRHWLAALATALAHGLLGAQPLATRLAVDFGVWTGTLVGLTLLQQHVAGRPIFDTRRLTTAFGVELVALVLGVTVAATTLGLGAPSGIVLLLGYLALTLEATRQQRGRERAEARVRAFERLSRAGRRLVTSPSDVDGVAGPLYRECRQVLRFDWFELELSPRREGDDPEVWSAGPDGVIHLGHLEIPDHPPARPGIHKRVHWELFEHELSAGGENALARLRLWCDPRSISPDSENLLRQLLPQLGGMVYRAVLGEQARTDPLTGAALRRVLDARLASSFERQRDVGGRVGVVLCDLDFFKRINDTHGHAAGDRALRAVAEVLEAGLREGDLCARYGGEEFALLLEDLPGLDVLQLADRLRRNVEALAIDTETPGSPLSLTLSAGIAVYPEVHCQKPQELLELADVALYEAKRLGRNGCLLYQGGGRYRDAQGRIIETRENGDPVAPQIFA